MVKEILGHPDYAVTDEGEVISSKGRDSLRVLVPDFSNGYARVTIDGKRYYLANLVAEYFLPRPKGPDYKVFFIDGNTTNCCVENLAWLSPSDIKRYSQYTVEYRRQILGEW